MRKFKKKSVVVLGALLAFLVLTGESCDTAERRRIEKTNESNQNGGLDRIVYVYDYSGNLLRTYEGRIDIEENDAGTKVLFDYNVNDDEYKRIVLYNATVIVEEK